MAEPTTWQLLGDFETCLQRITTANGFHTNAGLAVTREPSRVPDSGAAVIAVALGRLDPPDQPGLARTHRKASVLIVAKVAVDDPDDQARLHDLLADITRALDGQAASFGAGRSSPSFVSATPIPPEAGVKWLGLSVIYSAHVLR